MRAVILAVRHVALSILTISSLTGAYQTSLNGGMEAHQQALVSAASSQPHWISQGSAFWFRRISAPKESTFIYVDPEHGINQPAFNHEEVARALRNQGVEASATDLPFSWIDANDNCTAVRFRAGDRNWEWSKNGTLVTFDGQVDEDDPEKSLAPLTEERPPIDGSEETTIKFTNQLKSRVAIYWINSSGNERFYQNVEPGRTVTQDTYEGHVWRAKKAEDGSVIASFAAGAKGRIAVIKEGLKSAQPASLELLSKRQSNNAEAEGVFVRDNNAWYRDANGQETQLSTTGTPDSPLSNYSYFSPDMKFVVLYQYTPQQDHIVSEVESSPEDQLQPRLKQFQYLKAGDRVHIDRPRMFDLTTMKEVPTDDELFRNPYSIAAMNGSGWHADGWSPDGTEFRFVFNQRGHKVLRIVGMSTQGKVRAVVEDTSDTFIDYAHKLYYREIMKSNTTEMIWASERDGWNHLYMYDLSTGKVKNQITKGEFVVRSVDSVDEEARRIYVKVLGAVPGQDPYYAHLARVNFDGSDFKILTEGDGSHSWSFSPDGKTFTDTWSRMDMAAKTVTRDSVTGKETSVVQEGNLDSLLWPVPERFAAPGRDGETMIYGLIFRPYEMDNSTKYPVIENIYAGPQDFSVPKEWSLDTYVHRLANMGFVVVMIDGMGTNWRSKAFHDVCHKNLKDAGFPDRIAWMKAAASTRPWMDLDHVGVYGTSAGGQNAMGAVLFHNDFYSVAVADSGCHDNRMDKLWWNEAWMGYPVDQSYEDSSNVVNAHLLKGRLMLTVPELDTNVDPASTMQVVNALNRADKEYDLLFMPGAEHGVGATSEYALKRRTNFLYRGLKGIEPPQ